jgi:hypothetical protein
MGPLSMVEAGFPDKWKVTEVTGDCKVERKERGIWPK